MEDRIVHDLWILVFAAIDGTRAALLNSIYLLGKHTHIQETIYQDVKANKSLESMVGLKYFILEQFRIMSSSFAGITRTVAKNSVLGKLKLYKGTQLEPFISGPAFCEENFAKPEEFNINRYKAEDIKNLGTRDTLYPFSIGKRNCPGRFIGWSNIEIGIVSLLKEFEFKQTSKLDAYDFYLGDNISSKTYYMNVRIRQSLKSKD